MGGSDSGECERRSRLLVAALQPGCVADNAVAHSKNHPFRWL